MANKTFFQDKFKQTGNCCQIACCAFVCEYYANLAGITSDTTAEVFAHYSDYIVKKNPNGTKVNSWLKKTASFMRSDKGMSMWLVCYQNLIQAVFSSYCINNLKGHIGAEHLKEFAEEILKVKSLNVYAKEGTLSNSQDVSIINNHLAADGDSLAMVLIDDYKHWVVVGRDSTGVLFYRDPNNMTVSSFPIGYDNKALKELLITEYILFRPK